MENFQTSHSTERLRESRFTSVEDTLKDRIVEAQKGGVWIQDRIANLSKYDLNFQVGVDGGLRLRGRIVIPKVPELKLEICDEAHKSRYTVHPSSRRGISGEKT